MIPFDTTFGSRFLHGTVIDIDLKAKKVVVKAVRKAGDAEGDSMTVDYTDLVLAVGTTGPSPGRAHESTIEEATKVYVDLANEVLLSTLISIS